METAISQVSKGHYLAQVGYPRLSIVIPCFNGETTLYRCLSSIFQSSLSDQIQVIVVDDGSNDDSIKLANQCFASMQFHGSSAIVPQENKGAPEARNTGLRFVVGPRVIFLDVDDFFLGDLVYFMVSRAESNTDVIAGNYCHAFNHALTNVVLPLEIDIPTAILQGKFTIPGAIAIKTEVARAHLWNTGLSADQDGEWTGRLLLSGQSISFHPEISLAYSLENTNSISRKASRLSVESRAEVCEILLEKLNNSASIPEDTKSTYRNLLAQRLDSIAFSQFHVTPTFCLKLYRRAQEISSTYLPLYNGKSGMLRKLLGFHLAARTLMLVRR